MSLVAKALTALLVTALAVPATQAQASDQDFHLKPGGRGKLCLECHDDFEEILASKFVHTPLKKGNCAGCHNPHTSNHGNLLVDETEKVCFRCHEDIVPADATSVHEVAAEGQCVKCHDQHASQNQFMLHKPAGELCFECHTDMKEKLAKVKVQHKPVMKNCVTCHSPHASTKSEHLLETAVPGLCTAADCHATNKPKFKEAHVGYPVASARCTSCHDVHGSDQKGLLYNTVHKPVAQRKCAKCHMDPASANPFQTRLKSPELCQFCHKDKMLEIVGQTIVHWPVLAGKGCLNCHNPHASPDSGLLRGTAIDTCGSCHPDTIARQERSKTKHEPIAKGMCPTCHSPHGSDNLFYLNKAATNEVCGECHDWQTHVSHPSGPEVVDPRDRNLRVDCLSCHRSHGSEFEHFTHYEFNKGLCLQCHKDMQ